MRAIPELGYLDLAAARAFWTAAGFVVADYDEGFFFAARDGVELHMFQAQEPHLPRGGVYLHTNDVASEHDRYTEAGLSPSRIKDEPWGMREFSVIDPGGNRIRIGANS